MGYEKPHICFIGYSQTVIHVPVLCKKSCFPSSVLKYNEPPPPSTLEHGASCFETQLFGGLNVAARYSSAAEPESHQIQPFRGEESRIFVPRWRAPKLFGPWKFGKLALTLVSAGLQFLRCTACLRSDYFIRALI